MKTSKGFTIIELLVVIAIIAVLAAVVLVNVTGYINKGKDAAIKANMSTITTAAAAFYDDNSTFVNMETLNTSVVAALEAIKNANLQPTILTSATNYCTTAALKDGKTWCVDSTGYVGELGTGKCTGTTLTCK